MKTLLSVVLLTTLVSCGDDISSNSKKAPIRNTGEVTRPETSAVQSNSIISSHMHREKGSTVLSYLEEIKKTLANEPLKLYRIVPLMEKDDEGSEENVTTINDIGRPNTNCGSGSGFAGIDARITDCFQKNGDKALWDGKSYGAAGEGIWKLVLKSGTKEMWLDDRTGMVWSHILTPVNWCIASGNSENDTPDVKMDCLDLGATKTSCAKVVMDEVGDQVKWRLPTRNDFLQADLNGLRFVMKKEEETSGLWTATIRAASDKRSEAWVYNSKEGTLTAAGLDNERSVRCIGAPVR